MSIAAIRGLARSVPVVLAVVAYLALAMAASALILLGGPTWSPAGLLVAAVLPIIGFAAGVLVYRGQGTAAL
jgi:hypothetical protein